MNCEAKKARGAAIEESIREDFKPCRAEHLPRAADEGPTPDICSVVNSLVRGSDPVEGGERMETFSLNIHSRFDF